MMQKTTRYHRILSWLLVLLLAVTMFPTTALAVEEPYAEHEHTEGCSHETDEPVEVIPDSEPTTESDLSEQEIPADPEPETVTSGTIGESTVYWDFDPSTGRLMISGSGSCEVFQSPEDQPWAGIRTQITEVWFDNMESLAIPDLAYWFTGCTSLTKAEIPYTTLRIGTAAFADCPALTDIQFYYYDTDKFEIVPGAFSVDSTVPTTIWIVAEQQRAVLMAYLYDWAEDNRTVKAKDIYGTLTLANCAIGSCTCTSCTYTYTYTPRDSSSHDKYVRCNGCGAKFWLSMPSHSFSGNTCTDCGYTKSSGGSSGGGGTSTCSHSSTTTSWSGCNWTDYCRSCSAYIRSGTSHSYSYGNWSYYSSTQHKRTGTCTSCRTTTTSYGSHSTSTKYTQYSDTQHKTGKYCSSCSSYVGSTSYASHSFSYGSWTSYNDTQHRRTVSCSSCGYSSYEYKNHSLSYENWSSISATQHRRTKSCSCGYSGTETVNHTLTASKWSSASETHHHRTQSCTCGYFTPESAVHQDLNNDGYCDDCSYLMSRFSVTVPACMVMSMSDDGEIHTAKNVEIANRSTAAVRVTGITVRAAGNWTLVPYEHNIAAAKVDAKLVGFYLNGARTTKSGTQETLTLSGNWEIAKNAVLPLNYDAVVSATSQAMRNEQVLTLVFVLDWAA